MEYSVIVNDVFIDKNINKIFRVIWTSDDSSFHYVIAMEGETGLPIKMLHKDIINGFSDGHLEKIVLAAIINFITRIFVTVQIALKKI